MSLSRLDQQAERRSDESATPSLLQALRETVVPFLVSRAAVFISALALQPFTDRAPAIQLPDSGSAPLAALTSAWDSVQYANIALNGYSPDQTAWGHNYYFFPLYPLAIRVIALLFGFPPSLPWYGLAGVVLNHVLLWVALALLYTLTVRLMADAKLARRSVWVLAVLPWSFTLSMAYTEPLFLALALAAMLAALPGMTWSVFAGGALAALALLTRPQGLAVVLAVVCLVAFVPVSLSGLHRASRAILAALPAAIALFADATYVAALTGTGDLLAIPRDRERWGIGWLSELLLAFQVPLGHTIQPMLAAQTLTVVLMLGLGAWGCAFAFQRLPQPAGVAFAAFTALYLLMPLVSAPTHAGWGRYLVVAFPASWALASNLGGESLRRFAVVSLLIQAGMLCAAVLVPVTP